MTLCERTTRAVIAPREAVSARDVNHARSAKIQLSSAPGRSASSAAASRSLHPNSAISSTSCSSSPLVSPGSREVFGPIDESPENGRTRPNAGNSKLGDGRAVVVRTPATRTRERECVRASPCASRNDRANR
jgi:hypothetical protein